MQKSGAIVRFDAARGFGFIRCADSEADVFFHVRDFRGAGRAPLDGMAVEYQEIHVGGKGPRAMAVRPRGTAPARAAAAAPRRAAHAHGRPAGGAAPTAGPAALLVSIAAYAGVLGWAAVQQRLPVPVLLAWPVLNVLTFVAYWRDKDAAQQRTWRTPERTLHTLSLLGGWPAAGLAQQVLRHKSRKVSFRSTYHATVLGHWAALAAWLWAAPGLRAAGL